MIEFYLLFSLSIVRVVRRCEQLIIVGLSSVSLDLAKIEEKDGKVGRSRFRFDKDEHPYLKGRHERTHGGRGRERQRGGEKMAAWWKSDTKSKETPSQSAAPPLYHWVLASARCHPRALPSSRARGRVGIIIIIFALRLVLSPLSIPKRINYESAKKVG